MFDVEGLFEVEIGDYYGAWATISGFFSPKKSPSMFNFLIFCNEADGVGWLLFWE